LRYWLSGLTQQALPSATLPIGTMTVNVIGCFAIGLLLELAERRALLTPDTHALLIVGVLGGFTTFSTFANDTFVAYRAGASTMAVVNVAASVSLGLAAVWLGRAAGGVGR
jgi:CrcB protein